MKPLEQPDAALRSRFLAAASRSPATPPGAWRRRVTGAAVFAVGWTLLTCAILGPRSDWADLPARSLAQTFVVLLAVVGGATAVGLTRGRVMSGASSERLGTVVVLGLGVLLALVLTVDPRSAATRTFEGAATVHHAIPCAVLLLVVGLPLLGAALVPLAGLTLARPGLTGAALGLAAATLAHAVLRFHCGIGGPGHALCGHLLSGIPLMALGTWWSRGRVVERMLTRVARR
jgi:hypothetical protein